jgi:hypothetical protein
MRRAIRTAKLPALLTFIAIVLMIALTGRAELVFHVYVLMVAAIALAHLVRAVRAVHPPASRSGFDSALRKRKVFQQRLPELERVERAVTLGMTTAFDLHYRLRPSLRRTATELLAVHRGIDLDRNPDAARNALGDETWEIVREDREPPADRSDPGIDIASLRAVVTSLEAI